MYCTCVVGFSCFTAIATEIYDVLYAYLMGDSRKNELYLAKNMQFFEVEILKEVRFLPFQPAPGDWPHSFQLQRLATNKPFPTLLRGTSNTNAKNSPVHIV